TAQAGDEIEEAVAQAAARSDGPGSLIRALAEDMVQRLEGSDYKHGCSIATMVLELAPYDEELTVEFDTVFARWRAALVGSFETWGVAPDRGVVLADLVMSGFEAAPDGFHLFETGEREEAGIRQPSGDGLPSHRSPSLRSRVEIHSSLVEMRRPAEPRGACDQNATKKRL